MPSESASGSEPVPEGEQPPPADDTADGDPGKDEAASGGDLAAELLVRRLLDGAPDIITVLNADGSWRYSNAAGVRLVGELPDFDPVTGVLGLLHSDDVAVALEALRRVRAGELPAGETLEVRVRGEGGEWRYLESTVEDLIDDPVVHGIVIRSEDVTERRESRLRLLEANERLSTLIGSLHIAAVVEDTDRAIVLTNEAFVDLL